MIIYCERSRGAGEYSRPFLHAHKDGRP